MFEPIKVWTLIFISLTKMRFRQSFWVAESVRIFIGSKVTTWNIFSPVANLMHHPLCCDFYRNSFLVDWLYWTIISKNIFICASTRPWLVSFACFHQEDNMTFPYVIFEEFAKGEKYALELTDQKEQKT